ncbi:MAG: ferrous iron transport protein B [Acutalibacteraceae bacterium]
MGLTNSSIGINAVDSGLNIRKNNENDKVIALAGNPNVGKSTVFNALTGMNQHTGNWPGKTVTNAYGYCSTKSNSYIMVDLPGTYSLMAHSSEEEVARNFICFGSPDAVVVVCDATCLERNLNLCLQTIEISKKVIVCVNLMDEAKRKNIKIDLNKISKRLGVPVVSTVARKKKSLDKLTLLLDKAVSGEIEFNPKKIIYRDEIEEAIDIVEASLCNKDCKGLNTRWLSLKLLDYDKSLFKEIDEYLGKDFLADSDIINAVNKAKKVLAEAEITSEKLKDEIVSAVVKSAEEICKGAVVYDKNKYSSVDRKIDKVLTSKRTGYPIMLALLAVVFWITISGANYPSQLLSSGLFYIQDRLTDLFQFLGAPDWLHGILVLGVYRVLAWVVSVMLPPMAIFFPLFTLLEDTGYLPRIAYNLDKPFKRCNACGKQALTMCMGFGCNAAGVVGCRIIDSKRERLLAILTNNFVPCNGRFPTIISIITMFFIGASGGFFSSVSSALLLTLIILFGVFITFFMTKLLSKTILKGMPSSFTLELPPYRKPQIGKVIVRSIFDRTLFVLGRAAAVAAPAGAVIWLMANINFDGGSLLNICADFLDPFARLIGLDGVILIAFILGFPANEIVIPIIIMAYMAQGSIMEFDNLMQMKELFVNNGWTVTTAVCTMMFSLLHWPCSTTLMTIKKETGSFKWAAVAAVLPTVTGIILCFVFSRVLNLVF